MFKLLDTLIFIFLILMIFRYIGRYVIPFLLKSWVSKKVSEMQQNQQSYQQPNKREGEVTIEYQPENKKHHNRDSGEYVDYEEVK